MRTPILRNSSLQLYLPAVAAVAAVTAVRVALEPFELLERSSFMLYAIAVVAAGWLGGFGPGMAATLLSISVIALFFIPPAGSLWMPRHDGAALLLFFVQGILLSWLAGSRRNVLDDLERSHRELEQRVEQRTSALQQVNAALSHQMTENEQAHDELRAYSAQLQRSNRELQDFASVASHDLQEPLRKIQAFGDRLKMRCGDRLTEEGRGYLERMLNAAGRMQVLIDDLLTFSRVTTRARPFEPVDLAAIARAVISDLEARIEETGGRVELGDLPTIEADPMQIRQLFQNLLGNALKFRREGVPPVVRISGSLRPSPGTDGLSGDATLCEIRVEDNGIGFDEKYLDRIFNVFQRLHGRNVYEGTGIGLAVCRKIVERHGGTLDARSRPGEGSTFHVILPVRPSTLDLPATEARTYDSASATDHDPAR